MIKFESSMAQAETLLSCYKKMLSATTTGEEYNMAQVNEFLVERAEIAQGNAAEWYKIAQDDLRYVFGYEKGTSEYKRALDLFNTSMQHSAERYKRARVCMGIE